MKIKQNLLHYSFIYICIALLVFICSTVAEAKKYEDEASGKEYKSLNELIQNLNYHGDIVTYILIEYLDHHGVEGLKNPDIFEAFVREQHIIFPEESREYIEKEFKEFQQFYFTDKVACFNRLIPPSVKVKRYNSPNPIIVFYSNFEENIENLPEPYNNLAMYVADLIAMQRKYGVPEEELSFISVTTIKKFLDVAKRAFEFYWNKPKKVTPFLQNIQHIKEVLGHEWVRFENLCYHRQSRQKWGI